MAYYVRTHISRTMTSHLNFCCSIRTSCTLRQSMWNIPLNPRICLSGVLLSPQASASSIPLLV